MGSGIGLRRRMRAAATGTRAGAATDYAVERKRVAELSSKEVRECADLTLRGHGSMRRTLMRIRSQGSRSQAREAMTTTVRDPETNQLLAWGLLLPREYASTARTLHVYVRKTRRRQGLGARVVREAMKYMRIDVAVCPYNDTSTQFYKQCLDKLPRLKVDVSYEHDYRMYANEPLDPARVQRIL